MNQIKTKVESVKKFVRTHKTEVAFTATAIVAGVASYAALKNKKVVVTIQEDDTIEIINSDDVTLMMSAERYRNFVHPMGENISLQTDVGHLEIAFDPFQ